MRAAPPEGAAWLDRPVWAALTTRQSALAAGDDMVRMMWPEYGFFAATAAPGPKARAALRRLPVTEAGLYLLEDNDIAAPPGFRLISQARCVQMVAGPVPAPAEAAGIIALGEDDAAGMRALAALTRPGPFSTATHRLGQFLGIWQNGALVAMAGERLRVPGGTEVSGVCVHPDWRGRNYARLLSAVVARRIQARGEMAFLHAYESNRPAVALYETLNFQVRKVFSFIRLEME